MAQRGLLTLRNCDNPEARNCTKCGRPMCSEHLSARSGHTMCLECAAADPDKDRQYDAEWASGYRREYYRRNNYAPILFGIGALGAVGLAGAYWDHVDRRAFHASAANRTLDDDDGVAGFGDS